MIVSNCLLSNLKNKTKKPKTFSRAAYYLPNQSYSTECTCWKNVCPILFSFWNTLGSMLTLYIFAAIQKQAFHCNLYCIFKSKWVHFQSSFSKQMGALGLLSTLALKSDNKNMQMILARESSFWENDITRRLYIFFFPHRLYIAFLF